jgi:LmbE family N-acetylglucosaminyl deacetylase
MMPDQHPAEPGEISDAKAADEASDHAKNETGPKRVAVIMAHPDDPDFVCGGTCARWAAEGHHITFVLITNGDKGSDDRSISGEELVRIREAEQRAAAAILGVQECVFMRREDGVVVPNLELRRELVRVIRQLKPDVVICQDPTSWFVAQEYINHPDHRAAGHAVLEAIFPAARNHRMFPELLAEGLETHRVEEVYVSTSHNADTWIDITEYIDHKIQALRAHVSQMGDWDPDEPIREWNREDGKKHDPPVEYAEDFRYFKLD